MSELKHAEAPRLNTYPVEQREEMGVEHSDIELFEKDRGDRELIELSVDD